MATRQYRLNEFDQGAPPYDQPLELLCEDNRGTYVLPYRCDGVIELGLMPTPVRQSRQTFSVGECLKF